MARDACALLTTGAKLKENFRFMVGGRERCPTRPSASTRREERSRE